MARAKSAPETKMVPLKVTITRRQEAYLEKLAELDGLPTAERIRRLLDEHVKDHPELRGFRPVFYDTRTEPETVSATLRGLPEADSAAD